MRPVRGQVPYKVPKYKVAFLSATVGRTETNFCALLRLD